MARGEGRYQISAASAFPPRALVIAESAMSLGKNIVFGCVLTLSACGGSSSETPFPLEPDFRREKAAAGPGRQVIFSGRQEDASAEPGEPGAGSEEQPAIPTWGASTEPAGERKSPAPEPDVELEPE
jgi:hypothetical protein